MSERKILVVDDEKEILSLFKQIFFGAGYSVSLAESAEVAIEIMQKTPHWVLFVDLNLPGMNGLELCKLIRNQYPMAIIFAVTGYASLYELADCRDAGFEDYFTKPATKADLLNAAKSAFEKLERWGKR